MKKTKSFSVNFVNKFAKLSGDYNPIHINQNDNSIIHGMALVLQSLEDLKVINKYNSIEYLKVNFNKFLYINEEFNINYKKNKNFYDIIIYKSNYKICKIILKLSKRNFNNRHSHITTDPPKTKILNKINLAKKNIGILDLYLSSKSLSDIFPNISKYFDKYVISIILSFSRLIGMTIPGKYSIFSNFEFSFQKNKILEPNLNWSLINFDKRWSYFSIKIHNNSIDGCLNAFERPKPVSQPTYQEILKIKRKYNFKKKRVFVIGGSKGIGEVCVKLLASYGAEIVFTYNSSYNNAKKIIQQCNKKNMSCMKFDISNFNRLKLEKLLIDHKFDYILYFATPKIFHDPKPFIDAKKLNNFFRYYILELIEFLNILNKITQKKVRFLVPSSVAVDDSIDEIKEYTIIKKFSEIIFQDQIFNNILIKIYKFHRVKTDQTASIHKIPKYYNIISEAKKAIKLMLK